ncbi:P-loop NTPase fold protein [Ruegeria atlantica]|uniref:P-loop NTPase fold protein n=1 Tax=Ruegeria atlantica TaxID=81569 RepID=UPI001479AA87|nr:P-loop NTPase fold protein [Ruegeria atlantica]
MNVKSLPNNQFHAQLNAYSTIEEPGYALMVDGPWGCGKTHVIQEWAKERSDCLYVSLYGAKNAPAIEECLFQALLQRPGFSIPSGWTDAAEGVLNKFTGANIDVTGAFRRTVLKATPRIIIFDDLERTCMPAPELLSVLNRFVEHEPRNVILLANQEELKGENDRDYSRSREKVIGRTVSLYANSSAALEQIFGSLGNDPETREALEFMCEHKDLIESVFISSETQNLRLLRYAVFDLARCLQQIPDDLRSIKSGMKDLVATFLALSITYQKSPNLDLNLLCSYPAYVRSRNDARGSSDHESSNVDDVEAFRALFNNHPHVYVDGSLISAELASAWICRGFASSELVETVLRAAPQFPSGTEESWQTLYWWTKFGAEEVEAALLDVRRKIEEKEFLDPLVILHVAGLMLDLSDHNVGFETKSDLVELFKTYIAEAEDSKRLPGDISRRKFYGLIDGGAAYGLGFYAIKSTEFNEILIELVEALDRIYWSSNPDRASELFELAQTNILGFVSAIDGKFEAQGVPDFSSDPILVGMDPKLAAEKIFGLPPQNADAAISSFKDRLERLEGLAKAGAYDGFGERGWMREFKRSAEEIALAASEVKSAQIRYLLERNLSFLGD